MQELTSLGGMESAAFQLNARSQVVGWAEDGTSAQRAVLWELTTGTVRPLAGGGESYALALNDDGDAVGAAMIGGEWRAVLWRGGVRHDLTAAAGVADVVLTEGMGINASGQIVALGIRRGTRSTRAFVLTPRAS